MLGKVSFFLAIFAKNRQHIKDLVDQIQSIKRKPNTNWIRIQEMLNLKP